MCYKYRVHHSEESKSIIDRHFHPLTEEKELCEYEQFQTALHLHYTGTSVQASSVSAGPKETGVVVTLITDLTENEVDSSLEGLVIKRNKTIPGLCLVITRLGS